MCVCLCVCVPGLCVCLFVCLCPGFVCVFVCVFVSRCNRLRCPLARMSGLQCFNMGHNGHGINLYGVSMTLMEN